MNETKLKKIGSIGYTYVNDAVIVWNRFYPSLMQFEKNEFSRLHKSFMENRLENELNENDLNKLKRNKIPLSHNENSYQNKFFDEYELHIDKRFEKFNDFNERKLPFGTIQFFNEECNLNCSYCIMKHTWNKNYSYKKHDKGKMTKNIRAILNQQYRALKNYPDRNYSIVFNGGEILTHFDVIQKIIEFVRVEKRNFDTQIALNTNATLITNEIIDFFLKYKIIPFISVDVNKIHHDKTRIYFNGKGSYDDVFCSLNSFKKKKFNLNFIQGTIQDFSLINGEELFEVTKFGVKAANIYCNVMGIKSKYGINRAVRFYNFLKSNANKGIDLSDSYINLFFKVADEEHSFYIEPFCNGLGKTDNKFLLMYNISNSSLSYTCQYVTKASQKLNGKINIHNDEVLKKTYNYQKERLISIKNNCKDCEIIGICRGGCILNGMDAFNKKNKASCNFWKVLWYLYLRDLVKYNVEDISAKKENLF